jgi:cell division protein FtsQ
MGRSKRRRNAKATADGVADSVAADAGAGSTSGAGGADVRSADERRVSGEPSADGPANHSVPADEAVLDELSRAFSERPTITIGGDDELPDAMYLDDELERGVTSGITLFIDDDGSADAVAPKEASTRGIEPRLRQRRIGVRRAQSRRRLRWVLIGGGIAAVLIAVLAVLGSSLFAVDQVRVSGNVYTDPTALQAVVDDLTGHPVLLVDTGDVEARIEAIPWVEAARVRTSFPNSATIEIRERTPLVAMLGADGSTRVLDRDGRVLDLIEGQPVALVWISGPGTLETGLGDIAPIGYSSAASLVTKLTPAIRSRLVSMSVTPDGSDLRLTLTGATAPAVDGASPSETPSIEARFGSAIGDNEQVAKLVRLERKLEDLGTDPVSVIDVSTAEVTVL